MKVCRPVKTLQLQLAWTLTIFWILRDNAIDIIVLYSVSYDRCHGNNIHKFSTASTVPAYCETCTEDRLRHSKTIVYLPSIADPQIGCRRFNNAIPARVITARNYIIRPSAQINKNNLICLPSRISEPPARGVNVDIRCLNVRPVKNKAASVADLVTSQDIDIFNVDENMAGQRRWQPCKIAQLVPDGYTFHIVSRPVQKHGGGVRVCHLQVRLESGKCVNSQ